MSTPTAPLFRPSRLPLYLGVILLCSACLSATPPLTPEEKEIKTEVAASQYMPATRAMRDAIETQELFAQAAFWSREYDLNPSDLESALKLAASVRKLGNPKRAVEITQITRALYPRDPYLSAEYAAALIADGRALDAMAPLNKALTQAPAYARLWSLKGAALDQQERFSEAQNSYMHALRITPTDPNILANLGLSYALAGDAATGETWLRRATAQPTASAAVYQNLALVLQLQGKTEEASKLASLNRAPQAYRPQFGASPSMKPQASPAANPAFTATPNMPATRLRTSDSSGQNFGSAAGAARAMASKNYQGQSYQGHSQAVSRSTPRDTSPEAQQAMLNKIARSLNPQAKQQAQRPVQQQAPQYNPATQGQGAYRQPTQTPYPQQYSQQAGTGLAGGPVTSAQPATAYNGRGPARPRH